ncbi:MAG: hypothetical protein A3D31_04915 [Candidatus Fluviicola riflensis]|nr:MAG: hypothetical protein CHH17_10105 [Candidatus Fluviicola riflensis]OGS79316.1 MAG: hypothetical protein A3D31_04915 [Candidatus Fluviicola riflensis]OGS86748.1 MAG: hypothetical protein A2724_04375 [Fluviicola sp. RIFCSPHIGHO2_01_FULL_43_53]OGS88778.1 MAG: hypothetical protein A3E30_00285 [Fluviicola sp. RIFCSPHIGHO2_12_FULL_43_24]
MENEQTTLSRKERRKTRTPEEKQKRKRKRRIIWFSIIGALIIFRLILPYIVLNYVNKKLANLEEYYGHVNDIDIHLYRGAYEIKDIRIVKKVNKGSKTDTIPFFKSPSIDLSIEWSSVFDGAIVGEIAVESPVINFVKERHTGEDVRADTADFAQLVDDLMPVTINRFDIHNGEIHYHDLEASPKLDVAMKNINVTATNLTNVTDSKELLPATLKATGEAYQGIFSLNMKFDGLANVPTFDMNTELKGLNLALLNDMLREYGNFDVKKGTFSLYGEFAAKEGKFGGYAKPFLKNLDVVQWNKQEGDVPQILWETVVGTTAEVVQNQRKEHLATKIPISGSFDNVNLNKWYAISYVLRNAFLKALRPSLDNSININKLQDSKNKTFLEKVFGGDPEKKEARKEKRAKRKSERKKK